MQRVPTRIHGVVDYATGALLLAAPNLLGFLDRRSTAMFRIAGGSALAYSLLTDYELGLYKKLPMPAHLALDAGTGVLLAVSPWRLGYAKRGVREWLPAVLIGAGEIAAAALTEPRSPGAVAELQPPAPAPAPSFSPESAPPAPAPSTDAAMGVAPVSDLAEDAAPPAGETLTAGADDAPAADAGPALGTAAGVGTATGLAAAAESDLTTADADLDAEIVANAEDPSHLPYQAEGVALHQSSSGFVSAPPPVDMPGPSVPAPAFPESETERAERVDELRMDPDLLAERVSDPTEALIAEEEAAAAAEARGIGGGYDVDADDPAMQAVYEAGGGEAEGFELAERDLITNASHADGRGDPLRDAFTPEAESDETLAEYGEPDQEDVTEVVLDPDTQDPDDPGAGPGLAADR